MRRGPARDTRPRDRRSTDGRLRGPRRPGRSARGRDLERARTHQEGEQGAGRTVCGSQVRSRAPRREEEGHRRPRGALGGRRGHRGAHAAPASARARQGREETRRREAAQRGRPRVGLRRPARAPPPPHEGGSRPVVRHAAQPADGPAADVRAARGRGHPAQDAAHRQPVLGDRGRGFVSTMNRRPGALRAWPPMVGLALALPGCGSTPTCASGDIVLGEDDGSTLACREPGVVRDGLERPDGAPLTAGYGALVDRAIAEAFVADPETTRAWLAEMAARDAAIAALRDLAGAEARSTAVYAAHAGQSFVDAGRSALWT